MALTVRSAGDPVFSKRAELPSGPLSHEAERAAYLHTLLEQRCTRPGWRVSDGGSRAVLWSLPGAEAPSHVVLIETDWDDPQLRAGRALMAQVHELAASLGADELGHTIDTPPVAPQYQEHPARS